ncbi:MAG: glycosyltransferase family 9 protein [Halobacteriovoraceae bacterium]|nr:glycosyltransferase family 9 protein [Halobacteriovoraceae bacterium]
MRILIARTDAIGDTVLTLPMASLLKKKFPNCQVVFLIAPKSMDLFKFHPYVDEAWPLDRNLSLLKQIVYLKKKFTGFNPTHFFYVGGSQLPSLMALYKQTPFRGGILSRWPTFLLLNKGVRQQRSGKNLHESNYNLQLLNPLNIALDEGQQSRHAPAIVLRKEEIDKSWSGLLSQLREKNHPCDKELIFIHPGMTGHTLNWPSINYAKLIKQLEDDNPDRFLFVLSHTPGDRRYVDEVKRYLKDICFTANIFYFDGSVRGLRDYMGVLSRAQIYVGPSTGTTHLANVLKIKTVAIYPGRQIQSPERWRPFNKDSDILKIMCPNDENMDSLSVEQVASEVNNFLE